MKSRLLFLGLMVLTVMATAALLIRVNDEVVDAAFVLRLVMAGLMTYLWSQWFRSEWGSL